MRSLSLTLGLCLVSATIAGAQMKCGAGQAGSCSSMTDGLLKQSNGIISIATAGVDYAAPGGTGVPSGMIAFTASTCPTGWTEYTAARGYAIVGLPASGTAAGTVGTALTNLQDKTHSHTYTDVVNHTHTLSTILRTATTGSQTSYVTESSDTSSTQDAVKATDNPAGGVATGTTATKATSDVMPYIQLRACSKD